MIEVLTWDGYNQTWDKLRDLEMRLAEIAKRIDLTPSHLVSVRWSYPMTMRKYLQDIMIDESLSPD